MALSSTGTPTHTSPKKNGLFVSNMQGKINITPKKLIILAPIIYLGYVTLFLNILTRISTPSFL